MFVVYFCILLPLSVSIHFNCMDKYSCFYHRRLPLFMMSIIYLYSSENIPEANCSSARTNLNLARFVLYSLLFFFLSRNLENIFVLSFEWEIVNRVLYFAPKVEWHVSSSNENIILRVTRSLSAGRAIFLRHISDWHLRVCSWTPNIMPGQRLLCAANWRFFWPHCMLFLFACI